MSARQERLVAIARQRYDGQWLRPGDLFPDSVPASEAADLIAMQFARWEKREDNPVHPGGGIPVEEQPDEGWEKFKEAKPWENVEEAPSSEDPEPSETDPQHSAWRSRRTRRGSRK